MLWSIQFFQLKIVLSDLKVHALVEGTPRPGEDKKLPFLTGQMACRDLMDHADIGGTSDLTVPNVPGMLRTN